MWSCLQARARWRRGAWCPVDVGPLRLAAGADLLARWGEGRHLGAAVGLLGNLGQGGAPAAPPPPCWLSWPAFLRFAVQALTSGVNQTVIERLVWGLEGRIAGVWFRGAAGRRSLGRFLSFIPVNPKPTP